MSDSHDSAHNVLETAQGPDGESLQLRRAKDGFEILDSGRSITKASRRAIANWWRPACCWVTC